MYKQSSQSLLLAQDIRLESLEQQKQKSPNLQQLQSNRQIYLQIKIRNRLNTNQQPLQILFQTQRMNQLQNNHTTPTDLLPQLHSNTQSDNCHPTPQFSNNEDLTDSDIEQNQAIVEAIFDNQKQIKTTNHQQENQQQEDQDIKRFLQEQIPDLYKLKETQQHSFKQEQENFYSYYNCNNSIAPQYFTMSRVEKLSYFQNLNHAYMARLNSSTSHRAKAAQNQNLIQNSDTTSDVKNNSKIKRAIKFNQIIFQVPFNKQQQPIVVKDTPEQQGYIVFDDQAYQQGDYDGQQQQQDSQQQQLDFLNSNHRGFIQSNYFDDIDPYEFQQNIKTKILSNICENRLELFQSIEKEKRYDSDSYDDQEEQEDDSLLEQDYQYIVKNSSSSTISSSDEDDKFKDSMKKHKMKASSCQGNNFNYKRSFNRKYISPSSSQEQSQQIEQNSQDEGQEQEDSFSSEQQQQEYAKFMKGRKISPVCFNRTMKSQKNNIQRIENQLIPGQKNPQKNEIQNIVK